MLRMVLNVSQYGWICLNETWICLNISEFTIIDKLLNMYHTIHRTRSLYNLMSSYWEIRVFRTQSKIKNGAFWKNNYSFLLFFWKKSISNLWEVSEYMLDFKYIRVLNIRKLSQVWQGSEYATGCSYGRVLNIPGFQVCHVSTSPSVA